MSTEVLVSLDGVIGCGRTSFETVIMLFTALKKTHNVKVLVPVGDW